MGPLSLQPLCGSPPRAVFKSHVPFCATFSRYHQTAPRLFLVFLSTVLLLTTIPSSFKTTRLFPNPSISTVASPRGFSLVPHITNQQSAASHHRPRRFDLNIQSATSRAFVYDTHELVNCIVKSFLFRPQPTVAFLNASKTASLFNRFHRPTRHPNILSVIVSNRFVVPSFHHIRVLFWNPTRPSSFLAPNHQLSPITTTSRPPRQFPHASAATTPRKKEQPDTSTFRFTHSMIHFDCY